MKRIIIIGGGISGLTAATLLKSKQTDVTILEASSSLGGLAKSCRTAQGYPTEHSLRIYHENYSCLFSIIKKIPTLGEDGKSITIYEQLIAMSLAILCKDNYYVYKRSSPKPFLLRPFFNMYELVRFVSFLYKQKLQAKDFLHLINEHVLDFACGERLAKIFNNMTMEEYLKNRSSNFINVFFSYLQVAFAATKNTCALLAMDMDVNVTPFSYYAMANGPTSERIITPWQDHIIKNGVIIKTNQRAVEFAMKNEMITGVKLASGEIIDGDLFVCAVSHMDFKRLISSAANNTENTHLKNLRINSEWSNGIQFYLSGEPKKNDYSDELNQAKVIRVYLDSPWKIVSILQGESFWKNVSLPGGCRYVLSVTYSEAHKNGLLFNKPFYECTKDEIQKEILHQCGFKDHDLILDYHLDDAIVFMSDEEYQEKKEKLQSHHAHLRQDGSWILNFSMLYTPTPEDVQTAPRARTDIKNLYLAGEFCKTSNTIPTMEKACESAYLASKAMTEDWNLPLKITLPHANYNATKHGIFRKTDAAIFKIQSWLKSRFVSQK